MRSGNKPSISKMAGVSPMKQEKGKATSRLTRINKKTGKLEIIENPGKDFKPVDMPTPNIKIKSKNIEMPRIDQISNLDPKIGKFFKDKGFYFDGGDDKFTRPISRKGDPKPKSEFAGPFRPMNRRK